MSNSFIEELILEKKDGKRYPYHFSQGINYFQGKNSSGKTEFFYFLDYMLGSNSVSLSGKEWFQDLHKATLVYKKDETRYFFTRVKDSSSNYFSINNEPEEKCNLEQYILFLSVIATNEESTNIKELRNITNTELTIRSCSAFNFLEETGILSNPKVNFLTKCREYKYQKWVSIILDYLFHPNSSEIYIKRQEIENLKRKLKEQQNLLEKLNIYKISINDSLHKLNSSYDFKHNTELIRKEINKIKKFDNTIKLHNLETAYILNNVSERLKILKNKNNDIESISNSAKNRMDMLNRLKELSQNVSEYKQFTAPLIELIESLSNTVSFSELLVKNKNERNLENVEKKLKSIVKKREEAQSVIDLNEKIQAISVIEELLDKYDQEYQEINIEDTLKKLEIAETELDELVNSIDQEKINKFQKIVMELYKSAAIVSPLIQSDLNYEGFIFDYDEKHNSIIPSIIVYDTDKSISEVHIEHYRGSQARSTIIQLCGYCALQLLLQEDKTIPCLPVLVIDHFSKTFSDDNLKALGAVLNKFYEMLNSKSFQTIVFDVKNSEEINLSNFREEKLGDENKSGFIPWINIINK